MPSYYLNQCCHIVTWTLTNKIQWIPNRNYNIFIQENAFENIVCEMVSILSRPQYVKGNHGRLVTPYGVMGHGQNWVAACSALSHDMSRGVLNRFFRNQKVKFTSKYKTFPRKSGIFLHMRSANERRCYIVRSSLIGWAHTRNDPWKCMWKSMSTAKCKPFHLNCNVLNRLKTPKCWINATWTPENKFQWNSNRNFIRGRWVNLIWVICIACRCVSFLL